MASGLRKLIRKARRFSSPLGITRRIKENRFGPRLRVEELEERIAPASVVLTPDHFTTYDVAGGTDGVWDATDGVFSLGSTSTVTDMTVTVLDDTTPAITGFTFTSAAAQVITIGSNRPIGAIDLSTLPTTATSLVLVVEGGRANVGAAGTGTFTDSLANTYTAATYTAGTGATTGGAATLFAGSGIGAITLPSAVNAGGLSVELIVETNATGALGAVTSTATGAGLAGSVGVSKVAANTIAGFAWAGTVVPGANAISVAGTVSVGTFSVGDVTLAGAGAVTLDGGSTGFTGAVSTGAITSSGAGGGDLSITTTGGGSMAGLVRTGAITNSGTNASNISIVPAGTGSMAGGFTATGLISNTAAAVNGALTIGPGGTGTLGPVSLAGITVASTADAGDVTIQGASVGAINSTAAIQTAAGAAGDIAFTAGGATGTMGAVTVSAGGIVAGQAGATIAFSANDGMGAINAINVTGDVGGAGAISFAGDAGGTANAGNIGATAVSGTIGNGAGAVSFSAVDLGAISAGYIGTGAGAVSFTANGLDATSGTGGGLIGTLTVTNDVASGAGGVTFTADDGMGVVNIGLDAAQGGNLTFDVNQDATDDAGAMGDITAQSLGNSAGATVVTIDTNSGATDNITERGVGAITITDGNGNLSITAAGDVGLISVTGSNGANGNDLVLALLNLNAAGDGANADLPDFAGIAIGDTAGVADTLTLGGAWTIPGTMGAIVVGGGDAADVMAMGANNINVYAGDDVADGFDVGFFTTLASTVSITAGDITGTGVVTANVKAASNLFTYVQDEEAFAFSAATGVTATIVFDPDANGGLAGTPEQITITGLAGTSSSNDVQITTSGASQFDCGGITPKADGLNVRNIVIEGDLNGNLGTGVLGFGDVDTIIIQGADNGNTFFGNTLKGYASTDGTLVTTGVNVLTLDTPADGTNDVVLAAGSIFRFADATGAAADIFNHHIAVPAGSAGATATIRGIDGNGNNTTDALYLFSGTGASGQPIDPAGVFAAGAYAMISRIMLDGTGGLGTDVTVREVDGTTNGSWLEFNHSVGLVNLASELDTISVGIDDDADLSDDSVETSVSAQGDTEANFDRLGRGIAGEDNEGLDPETSISDATAVLGNLRVWSMGDPGDYNINVVVTGNCGPITLTGDANTQNRGDLDTYSDDQSAAIAIGGDAMGAITIPGDLADGNQGDILIGIAIDANNDGDWTDAGETASGSLRANITIGDAYNCDILVADDILANIVVTGIDNNPEEPDLDDDGDLRGVKAGGTFGTLGVNVLVVQSGLEAMIADGALNSGLFVGGSGDGNEILIEGTGINGPGVVGGALGIDVVVFVNHAAFGDSPDVDWIETGTGPEGCMTVQWQAGDINNDRVRDVYCFVEDLPGGNINTFQVATESGDGLDVGNVFFLDDGQVNINSPSNIGVIVVADDVTLPSSEALQDLITTAYDVVYSPTRLETASGDQADPNWIDVNLPFIGSIYAQSVGGLIAKGDVDASIEVDTSMGYIVSLNGDVSASVDAGVSIGSIVASSGIYDSSFYSEGTLGVGVGTLEGDLTSFGLSGVPSWFFDTEGGVLVETGDIDNSDFVASGDAVLTQGNATFSELVMGTFYVVAGDFDSDCSVICGGSMGGIQAPTGIADMLIQVSMDGSIDRIIVANWSPASGSQFNEDRVGVFVDASDGDVIIVAGNPFTSEEIAISVTGGTTLAVYGVDGYGDDYILLVGGLAAGSSLVVNGNLASGGLIVGGDWAGLVGFHANAYTGEQGEVEYITVTGNILAGADLDAYNFGSLSVQGTTASAVTASGTLSSTNKTDDLTTLDDVTKQTLYLNGAKGVTAAWNSVFGKVTSVAFSGKGAADFATASGTSAKTEVQMKDFVKAGSVAGGAAHIGGVSMAVGSNVTLKNVLVQGDLDGLATAGNVSNLLVSGNAGSVNVGNTINRAFIGGSVDGTFSARIAKNVTIRGGVGTFEGFSLNKVVVLGSTDTLTVTSNGGRAGNYGLIQNSFFNYVSDTNIDDTYPASRVKVIRSVIGGLDEVPKQPQIVQNFYGYS